jgi:hypothetical protein
MPRDVLITPASGLVDFKNLAGTSSATIQVDNTGNLTISNSGGQLSIGNTATNLFIGDGVASVDVIFEQNGAVRALTGKTLTLGQTDSFVTVNSPLQVNRPTIVSAGLTIDGTIATGAGDMGGFRGAGTNLILKGDSVGRSGIFFQSEKDGVNINHASDYGFIQFHPYGLDGSSGESNRLVIGVANDLDDFLVLQAPGRNGLKYSFLDATSGSTMPLYNIYHEGNFPDNTVLNDIANQFNGAKTVFDLRLEQTAVTSFVDSKELEVVIAGQKLNPYIDILTYPWLSPYDSFKGFRVRSGQVTIYNAPYAGDSSHISYRKTSVSRQKRRYPFSAATIAFGD